MKQKIEEVVDDEINNVLHYQDFKIFSGRKGSNYFPNYDNLI